MSAKEELYIIRGLAQRINNMIFGYKKRGKDKKPRRRSNKK
mgnify:CR=1 FL=1|tara:strand:- start:1134 stop:1256 length:123 start_codon:yes stop_codon:yes gene_type:complete